MATLNDSRALHTSTWLIHFSLYVVVSLVIFTDAAAAATAKQNLSHQWSPSTLSQSIDLWDKINYPHRSAICQTIDTIISSDNILLRSTCRSHLQQLIDSVGNGTFDALNAIDSFTQRKIGNAWSAHLDLGDHHQCTNAIVNGIKYKLHLISVTVSPVVNFKSINESSLRDSLSPRQYYLAKIFAFHQYIPLMYAACLPSSCTSSDINSVFTSTLFNEIISPAKFQLLTNDQQSSSDTILTVVKFLGKTIIITVIVINFVCTYFFNDSESPLIRSFNAYENLTKLLSPPINGKSAIISHFKVMYSLLSTMAHTCPPITYHALYTTNIAFVSYLSAPFSRYSLFAMSTSLTSNFVISASLSMYKWLPVFNSRPITFIQFILTRMFRIVPLMIFLIFLIIIAPDFISNSHPLLEMSFANMSENCYQYSWRELLFISNYAPSPVKTCMPVFWFVSADMQLYIVSYIFIQLVVKSKSIFKSILPLVAIGFAAIIYRYQGFAILLPFLESSPYFFYDPSPFYVKNWDTSNYIAGYAIGIILGYFWHNHNNWSPKQALVNSILSIIIAWGSAFAAYFFHLPSFTPFVTVVIFAFQRILFPMGFAALLFSLWSLRDSLGTGVTKIDHLATILARLEYPYFLVHPYIISYLMITFNITYTSVMTVFLTIIPIQGVISLFIAAILHVLVEAPFARLFAACLTSNAATKKVKNS